jgi:outer membrane lipoprotein LolB
VPVDQGDWASGALSTSSGGAPSCAHPRGVDLPAARLPRWIQAAPAADAEVRDLDPAGRPQRVFDQGWRIDYAGYADDTAAATPRRLEISRGDARVRLIIDSWTALP